MAKQIKNVTNRVAKGMIAIFAIKLMLFGGIFLIQSCTQDSDIVDENIKNAEDIFLKSLSQTRENFNTVTVVATKFDNTIFQRTSDLEPTVMVKSLNENADIELNNLADVTNSLVSGDIELVLDHDLVQQEGDNLMQIQVSESDLRGALSTSVNASKNYLYEFGFSNSEINEVLLGQDESLLIQLVHANITVQNENNGTASLINENDFINSLFGIQTAQAQISWGEVGGCAAAAIGLDIIQEMRAETAGKNMTKKVLKKAFRKVAGKLASYLTGFGLAWTAAYFVGCLGFAYFN